MGLSDLEVRKIKPNEKAIKKADSGGLYLHVLPSGTKTWRMAFRLSGQQRVISFGNYPDVSLADARKQRDEAKDLIAQQIDPTIERQQEKERQAMVAASTFEAFGREWQEKRQKEKLSASAHRKDKQMLDHHAYPAIGNRPLASITAPEILTMIREVEAKGNYETAHRLRSTVSRVFRYGIVTGRAERDPAADLVGALVRHTSEHHAALFEPKEIGGLLRAINGYTGSAITRIAMLMLAHVFVRPGELRHAEWSEIADDRWVLPEAKMKMGKKLIVPLSPYVQGLVADLRQMTGSGRYLFPSVLGGRRPMSDGTVNAALRRLGYSKDEQVGHGFRRTASTILNESGLWNPDAIERQLAHVDGSVRGVYNSALHLDERVRMMTWWSEWLETQRQAV